MKLTPLSALEAATKMGLEEFLVAPHPVACPTVPRARPGAIAASGGADNVTAVEITRR